MSGFFGFLTLLAFVAFIVGMIKPQIMVFWSKKKTRGMALLYIVVMLVFAIIAGVSNPSSTPTSAQSSMAVSSNAIASVPSSKAPSNALTSDNIKAALKNANVINVDDVKISGSTITVIVYDKETWTVKTYLEQNQPHSAEAFKCVFGLNKIITKVIYQSDVSVTDSYGKASRVTAQTNTLTRDKADKVANWDTFEYENPSQYYSVVDFELAPESKINGLHAAWAEFYK